jgi:hypothetical protein
MMMARSKIDVSEAAPPMLPPAPVRTLTNRSDKCAANQLSA